MLSKKDRNTEKQILKKDRHTKKYRNTQEDTSDLVILLLSRWLGEPFLRRTEGLLLREDREEEEEEENEDADRDDEEYEDECDDDDAL